MFEPDIIIHKIRFKGFSKEGIKFEICICIKNNFIFAFTLNSLFGNLYVINRKIKISPNEKIGECFCYDSVKFEYNKMNFFELTLIIYWKELFLIIIPNIFFYSKYRAIIYIINKYIKEININIYCNFKLTPLFNFKYEIYISISGKTLCIPFNKLIIERIDYMNMFKEIFKLIKNKLKV